MSVPPDQLLQTLKEDAEPEEGSRIGQYFKDGYDLPSDWNRIRSRYRGMVETHTTRFHSPQLSIARAPGRVNLIGEHTDYNGLPVFPMAVDRDMAAVFAPRKDRKVLIINTF